MSEIGYDFIRGFILFILGLIIIGTITNIIFVAFQPLDSTNSVRFFRSGLVPFKDNATGIWYLKRSNILNADGTLYTKDK